MKRSGFTKTRSKPLKSTPLRRKAVTRSKIAQVKRKPSKTALWATYGLKKPPKPRYVGLAGVYWYVLSRYIRKSEFLQYHGECVDRCGRVILNWQEADCGHFRAASRGFCTKFLRENLGLQTKYCNNPTFSPDSSYGFGINIDLRYGPGTAERLTTLSNQTCQEPSKEEYDQLIRKYIKLFDELPDRAGDDFGLVC